MGCAGGPSVVRGGGTCTHQPSLGLTKCRWDTLLRTVKEEFKRAFNLDASGVERVFCIDRKGPANNDDGAELARGCRTLNV